MMLLEINDFTVHCNLGCGADERAVKQEVQFSLQVKWLELPKACETDKLEHTICYANLCEIMKSTCESKPFHTVEHLGYFVLLQLKKVLGGEVNFSLKVHKVNPPIDGLKNGISIHLGDLN